MYDHIQRLFDIPHHQLKTAPLQTALAGKKNGVWEKYSTQEYVNNGNLVSKALLKLGIKPGDKIATVSNNRPEWNMMDLGILQIGAINVPIYPTTSPADYAYIMNHCDARIIVAANEEMLEKVNEIKNTVPTLEHIYTFDEISGAKNFKELLKLGEDGNQDEVEYLKSQVKAEDLATLIYTSGTTGKPKGVMLSHRNIVSNAVDSLERFRVEPGKVALSFLPVCHIYERMLLYLYQLKSVEIWYAESMETIGDDMREVKPHVFTAVPRLLEKVYDKIMAKGMELSGFKRGLFFWAVRLAEKYEPYGKNGWGYEFKLKIARKLIFSKWRAGVGGRVQLVASGSAALQPRLARIYLAAQINVMEGYGLTETSPVISVNDMENNGLMIGSVGRPINNVKVKIAEDGEIWVKGPNVMMGYYKDPEKTREVITNDGWFKTGDIGQIVGDNFLKITDRKKEIFKTSGGKYIAPQVMENKFKESKFIENMIVVGEFQKHPSALIIPNFDFLKDWCLGKGLVYSDNEEMVKNELIIDRFQEEVDRYNESFGQWEKIKRFRLITDSFTIENELLTPTLKLKRKAIQERHKALIEAIYQD